MKYFILSLLITLLSSCKSSDKEIPDKTEIGYSNELSNDTTKNYSLEYNYDSDATEDNIQSSGSGSYLSYKFDYMAKSGRTAVVFYPQLPRNDAIVIGAMNETINTIFGKNKIINDKPEVVYKDGNNYLKLNGVGSDYYFLLIKDETGEVTAFTITTD